MHRQTPGSELITGFALCDAYALSWRELPFIMYNCPCTLNARLIGLTGNLKDNDMAYKGGKVDLANKFDCLASLNITICGIINKNPNLFYYSDKFIHELTEFYLHNYGIQLCQHRTRSEQITQYEIYSCLIDKEEAVVFLNKYDIPFVKSNNSISKEYVDNIISIKDGLLTLAKKYEGLKCQESLSANDLKTLTCIICKCHKKSHAETYDAIFPDKPGADASTKCRYVNIQKRKAEKLSQQFGLDLPPWSASL